MAPKPKFFTLAPEHASPALAAAELTMALLKHTTCSSLDDLSKRLEAGDEAIRAKIAMLIFEEAQMALMEAEHEVTSLIRIGPSVTVAECDACGVVTAVDGTPPRVCGVTLGCEGQRTKATVAKKLPFKPAE